MSRRNRAKRAAKQKQRRRSGAEREHPRSGTGPDRAQILERLIIAMSTAATCPAPERAADFLEQYRGLEREVDIAADLAVSAADAALIDVRDAIAS
jgi:hypothetical protein